MRFSRVFALCILVFLALVFVMQYRMPRRFNWRESYSTYSTQPFGCKIFDEVLATAFPNGYEVTEQTFHQLKNDSFGKPRTVIAHKHAKTMYDIDVESMLEMAERGDNIVLIGSGFQQEINDTLGVFITYDWDKKLPDFGTAGVNFRRDSIIIWTGDTARFKRHTVMAYPKLLDNFIVINTKSDAVRRKYKSLAHSLKNEDWHVVLEFTIGKGSIYLVSASLLFTNYGILDDECRDFVMRVLTQVGDRPVVRTTAYLPNIEKEEEPSPLRYFLKQKPLRWAIYLTLLTIIVFMIFTARRRQRIIPLVEEPQNRNREFVGLIATLYEQRRDYRDLVLKKFTYFAEELRREQHIDISDPSEDAQNLGRLAQNTGLEVEEIAVLIAELRHLQADEQPISRKTMAKYIKQINHIKNQLQ